MRTPDLDKERSEKKVSIDDFLAIYNTGLPPEFPRASMELLKEYRSQNAALFKDGKWSLDLHRKKFMDWLRSHARVSDLLKKKETR